MGASEAQRATAGNPVAWAVRDARGRYPPGRFIAKLCKTSTAPTEMMQ